MAEQEKLKENFGDKPWFPFFVAGKHILCGGRDWKLPLEHQELKDMLSEMTGEEPEDITYSRENNTFSEGYRREAEFIFPQPRFRLNVKENYTEKGDVSSLTVIVQKEWPFLALEPEAFDNIFYSNYFIIAHFEPNCLFFKDAQVWEYNQWRFWRRFYLNKEGDISRTVYGNRRIMSLEEIYGKGENSSGKSFEKILSVAGRTDRVLVTVLDKGVDYNHPELAYKIPRPPQENETINRISQLAWQRDNLWTELLNRDLIERLIQWRSYKDQVNFINQELKEISIGWDFKEEDEMPYDYGESLPAILAESFHHGTIMAGIISRDSDDIAILPVRLFKESKKYYDAIQYAFRRGSKIVNCSFGSDYKSEYKALSSAIKDHPDMLFVVAAGNESRNIDVEPAYPASFDHSNMIVVAAADIKGELWREPNYGVVSVDVAALGTDTALEPENSKGLSTGTSIATAQVSRIAAKIKFLNPQLTPEQIIAIIGNSVTQIPNFKGKVRYGGIVNEDRTLELAKTYQTYQTYHNPDKE